LVEAADIAAACAIQSLHGAHVRHNEHRNLVRALCRGIRCAGRKTQELVDALEPVRESLQVRFFQIAIDDEMVACCLKP
jgi:hypothetical protein